ncbi:MAG: MlaD family protein [Smithella sp.]|jgi:phospholipid/cholesterol/gamma-HCH transport system substrate-binding protein
MTLSRELKVGLFIGCTAVTIILALFFLAAGKGFFEKMHVFTLSSKSGDGFTEGMPVVFSGFNIGKVQALELDDKGIVLIKIKIPDRHVKWIRSDSKFVLYRPLIGAARIDVNTSNLNSSPLDTNQITEVTVVNDINDAIAKVEPVLEQVTQIAENIEHLTRNLSDPKGDLNRALSNAEKITSNLASKKSLVEMAVSDEESVKALNDSLKKLKDITTSVDRILKKVDKMADKTDHEIYGKNGALPQINVILRDIVGKLQKLDKTVDNINKISTDTSEGMKDFHILRSDIDDAVNALGDVVKKLDAIIGSKKSPEFKVP